MYNEKLRKKLLEEVRKDEHYYCFDPSYYSNEQWNRLEKGKSRQEGFEETMNHFNNMTVEEIMEVFGDKYNYVFEEYKKEYTP